MNDIHYDTSSTINPSGILKSSYQATFGITTSFKNNNKETHAHENKYKI
jgi:hypothetical protein